MEHIGEKIAEAREKARLTQAQLGEKIGTTQSAVARMESGKQNITTAMLRKIGVALNQNLIGATAGSVNLEVHGGKKLSGTVVSNTSKNGAVGLLCASLLNKGTTTLHKVPHIEEVFRLLEVLESIGVRIEWDDHTLHLTPPSHFRIRDIDVNAARRTRSIVMFIGSLMHHLSAFSLPQSGGCKLGSRTVRPHFFALEKFGVHIDTTSDAYEVSVDKKHPEEVILYESGDTVTENALFAAALTPGTTVIKYASANYMVQEICHFLELCGVRIEGIGTTTLVIHGVSEINSSLEYTLAEDPIDAMFFIATAIVTASNIRIERCPIDFLELELLTLEKMGLQYEKSEPYLSHNNRTLLVDITIKQSTLSAAVEKIHARPYPGLNADNLPFFAVIAAVAKGQTLIHDWMYEKRAIYFTELDKLGADTALADPHRIFINGPTTFRANELVCPPALRPATILLIAMLAADGTSVLRNIYSINRGYENLVPRLQSLGAQVEYLEEF